MTGCAVPGAELRNARTTAASLRRASPAKTIVELAVLCGRTDRTGLFTRCPRRRPLWRAATRYDHIGVVGDERVRTKGRRQVAVKPRSADAPDSIVSSHHNRRHHRRVVDGLARIHATTRTASSTRWARRSQERSWTTTFGLRSGRPDPTEGARGRWASSAGVMRSPLPASGPSLC